MFKCFILNVDNGGLVKRGMGAYRIATFLREHDWNAEVIEFAVQWSLEDLKLLARQRIDSNFKFIGISALFLNASIPALESFLAWIKQEYPHIKIVIGGPERYRFDNLNIDYNLNGYGENALLVLLKYLFSNGSAPKFSMFLNSGRNIPANEYYPSYPMKSLMIKYEDRDFIDKDEWLGVEFSRGCAFACAFCNFPVLGVKGDYTRDADDFRQQMTDTFEKFGVTNYYCSDETFNDRTEKITKFADVVETLPFTPYFTGFVRGDLLVSRPADREELLRMRFLGQFYGIETFNHAAGKAVGKGMNPNRLKQGLIDVRKFYETSVGTKYLGTVSLIAGLPHESKESLYESHQWLLDHWQGQAFNMGPLEIPNNDFYHPSKISMDYKKYGYRDASGDPDIINYTVGRKALNLSNILLWKNEYMSIKEAEEISVTAERLKDSNNFRANNYTLIRTGEGNLEDRLKIMAKNNPGSPTAFIKNYIEQKLGL